MMFVLVCSTSFSQIGKTSIPFLNYSPVIDGLPDRELATTEWRSFATIKKTSKQNKDYTVRYKIGYTYSNLYILIEASCDTITIRDRGYQNGDGLHMVVGKPNMGMPTDEFYVLAFSPANRVSYQPSVRATWYYNVDLSFKQLSASAKFECQSVKGKSYFELQLPWDDVYPYHPLFSDSVGVNLCFVKATSNNGKNYYYMKHDKRIQQEQSRRDYTVASFEKPLNADISSSFARLLKRNIVINSSLKIKMTTFSPIARLSKYVIDICSVDNYTYSSTIKTLQSVKGLNTNEFDLPVKNLSAGGYKVVWRCTDGSRGEIPFTILPEIDEKKERDAMNDLKANIPLGDYHTMEFMLNSILKNYSDLKEYEAAGKVRENYQLYCKKLIELQQNKRLTAEGSTISRRAFLSKIDSTLQPYTIKLPSNYDKTQKYPLFVFLHGSGATDEGMLNGRLTDGKCIEIAPLGRGTSNCFTTNGAEIDVKEAIEDAIKNYSVDTTKIVIAGFSMGGYGAYRIYYEYPELFKGVAVFAGHPNLAKEWEGEGYPDFLLPKYLEPFKKVPTFIYHSKNDVNCPFDLTKLTVDELKKMGCKVEFVTTEEAGHGVVEGNNLTLFYNWLEKEVGISTN